MSWITLLLITLTSLILIDHLGSRRLRKRVRGWAAALFAQAKEQPALSAQETPGGIRSRDALPQQTVRLKVKGARRSTPVKGWIPLEGKIFVAPGRPAVAFYADLIRWAFFSQKEILYLDEKELHAQRFLFSVLAQKVHFTRDNVRALLLAGLPWWPSLLSHPDLELRQREAAVFAVRWADATASTEVDWHLDKKNRWKRAVITWPDEQDTTFELHVTDYRTFDNWEIPGKLSVVPAGMTSEAAVLTIQLTEWIANEPYHWW